jgi:hypothetical protein
MEKHGTLCFKECDFMKPNIEELRSKYMANPPEGMTSRDIQYMSEDDLLDMDYFLNDDELDDDYGEEGFYIF